MTILQLNSIYFNIEIEIYVKIIIIIIVLYERESFMKKIFLTLAILLTLGNTADAKNYITLESPAGNTIVDETGQWILGPYKDLHVNYIIDFGERYAYASFYDNSQKRYINLNTMAYLPSGYDYEFSYEYAKALTKDGFKLVKSDGTYAINDVVSAYYSCSDNLIFGKKGEFWYLYNISTGSLVIDNPITSTWENVNTYYNGSGEVVLLKIETADGYVKYVTNDGIEIDEDTAIHNINIYKYRLMDGTGTGEGNGYSYNGIRYSREPSTQFIPFSIVDKKGKTLYGIRLSNDNVLIAPKYNYIEPLGDDFKYFIAADKHNKYGIINLVDKVVIPFKFKSFERLSDRSFMLRTAENAYIFNAENGMLVDKAYDTIDTSKPIYMIDKFTVATLENKKYVIDSNDGHIILTLPETIDDITAYYDDLYVVQSGKTYGLMNRYGKILVNPEFDKVTIDEPIFNNYMKYLSEHDD